VAPRTFSVMRLGTNAGASGLQLSDAEIDRFVSPAGVLRLGDTSTASQLSVEGPISINPASVGALTLLADGSGITQTTGSTITATNLRLQTTAAINLTEANPVGMLAGTTSGSSFNFTAAGALGVGQAVDGAAGLSGGPLGLKADDIVIAGPGNISNNSVTLATRTAGAAMNLGTDAPGTFSVDATEIAKLTGNNLTFSADVINVTGAITPPSTSATVGLAPLTAMRPVSLGVETAGAMSLTQEELALIKVPTITIGNTVNTGPVSVSAPLDLDVNTFNLRSAGAITQSPGAPIRLTRVNANGTRVGTLDVQTSAGRIFLPAQNEVPGAFRFSTGGTANDVDFVNALPMKLQSVNNFGVSGKVRINSALFVPLPVVPGAPPPSEIPNALQLPGPADSVDQRHCQHQRRPRRAGEADRKKAEDEKKKQQECR
jgi:hypothetical protein